MINIKNFLKKHQGINYLYLLIDDFLEKEGPQRANSLAYVILLAFVPFFVSIASIIGFFLSDKTYAKIESFFMKNYLPEIGEEVLKYMRDFNQHAGSLSLISFIFLFVTSIMMINSLSYHLGKLWSIPKRQLSFKFSVLINFILMTIGPLILGVTIVATSYILSISNLNYPIISNLSIVLATILGFTLIYKLVPAQHIKFKHAFLAGLFAGISFEVVKRFFVIYVKYFAAENILYGALATLPILLLWLYISCLILLLGAHVTAFIIKIRSYSK